MDVANKLELHYYFQDDSHSMDAHVRNKCEAELLALIKEVAIATGLDFTIDAEALNEGGLKNRWKILGKNSNQITTVLLLLTLILQTIQYFDKEDEMDIELKKLSIEEKRLAIEKLKKELETGLADPQTIKETAQSINNDFKVLTRKSNIYKQLDKYEKITKLGISSLTEDNTPINEENVIEKRDFYKFILSTDKLPDLVIENAEIEIVSPVIVRGQFKWKGIYMDETISFTMGDSDFKNDVLSRNISFQHGAIIQCVLRIGKVLDETGEVTTSSYIVDTVISKIDGDLVKETSQGKKYKFMKKFKTNQKDLF